MCIVFVFDTGDYSLNDLKSDSVSCAQDLVNGNRFSVRVKNRWEIKRALELDGWISVESNGRFN